MSQIKQLKRRVGQMFLYFPIIFQAQLNLRFQLTKLPLILNAQAEENHLAALVRRT
jgi:hypothetical protein